MAVCVYCQKNAGLFRQVHRTCREEYTLKMLALRDVGRFKDAVMATEAAINRDPPLGLVGNQLLSSIYFAAMCNDKEPETGDVPRKASTIFHGMEEHLRAADPSLFSFLYEEPSEEELDYKSLMRGCTLEALECNYAYARELAKRNTEAVLMATRARSPENHSAFDILETIRMMDEMYGTAGDDYDPVFAKPPEQKTRARLETEAQAPKHSEILEEMIQLKEAYRFLFSGAVTDRITGVEASILMRKKMAGLVGGGSRVFPVSDTADEAEISRWFNHPGMDITKTLDRFVVDMAQHAQVPTKMMERILRTLLHQDYEEYYQIATSRLRQRRQPLS